MITLIGSEVMALLVDLDGTLVDTATANFFAYSAALEEAGVKISRSEFDQLSIGRHWRQFLPAMVKGSTVSAESIAARKAELYPEFASATVVNKGLLALIRFFQKSGRVALVTTASRANVKMIVEYHGLLELFQEIITADDVTRHKPDPEAYQLAADRFGLPAEACLIIEDSDAGVASARSFGSPYIRVSM